MLDASAFHNGGQIEDDGLDNKDVYVELGDDSVEDIECKHKNPVSKAVKIGLSKKGKNLNKSYKSISQCL